MAYNNPAQVMSNSHHDVLLAHPKIHSCLSAFVRAVLDCPCGDDCDALNAPDIISKRNALLPKLAMAEYEMEKFYARGLAAKSVLTDDDLNTFIYRDNYDELVREEISAARAASIMPDAKPIVFVGAGPLPLTAIDMYKQTGLPVVCVDFDDDAIALSTRMIAALGLADKIKVVRARGEDFDYAGSGLVMVAALVGGKDDVLARIRNTAPDAGIAVRSAEGVRTLLYAPVNENDFTRAGYAYVGKSRITPTIINTTLFFQPS